MYEYTSIEKVSDMIRTKEISPVNVTKNCLERIEKLNSKLNAFITVNPDALKLANIAQEEIAAGHFRGPLHGIPVGVKDFYDTAGMRTTAGFVHFKDRVPKNDAEVVTRLKDGGAIIIGKTNMHELGMGTTSHVSYFGGVHNPWNEAYVAGGSSGGSAAAVASGMCFATIDTDAIGSCRIPSSCCGVVGFKGTYGLINSKGILEGEKTDEVILKLAHPAITTRWVSDSAIVLDAIYNRNLQSNKMRGKNYFESFKSIGDLRIAITKNFTATNEIRDIFLNTAEKLKEHVHTSEIEVPFEAASFNIKNIDKDRQEISNKLFRNIDLLLLPTVTDKTPTIKEAERSGPMAIAADNTLFCNYFALPVINIPCGFTASGMPVGFQIVGRPWEELTVLSAAYIFEKWIDMATRFPVLDAVPSLTADKREG